jgi:phage terminase large subunit-like protein
MSMAALPTDALVLLREKRRRRSLPLLPAWTPRQSQVPPDTDWRVWLILAGRGWGKTRTGAEWVRQTVKGYRYVNLIAPTADDARDIMIEGESGILNICPPSERPAYITSKRRLEWPNGATSLIFTADEPERLRGKQHMALWADEIAAWRYPESWDQAMFGLRLGDNPRAVATTTPRPVRIIRDLVKSPTTAVTRGSTYENRENLAPAFLEQIIAKYEGTRMGRQELHAEVLDDVEGALWTRAMINVAPVPDLRRVVVAIDPAMTSGEDSDETGIIVAGVGVDGNGYVLADRSCRLSPDGWAKRALAAFHEFEADRVVAETNNGGDMVETVIRTIDRRAAYTKVHASRGKRTRAEPVAALYEQGKVFHAGVFSDLEDQLCGWTPDSGDSPDRLDALVWALTTLMVTTEPSRKLVLHSGGYR